MAAKQQRAFDTGEQVKIRRKSHVIDKERAHENLPEHERIPIEQEVTGVEGEVMGPAYASPEKGGAFHVPISTPGGVVLGVPEDRLERVKVGGSSKSSAGWSRAYERAWDSASKAKKPKGRAKSRKGRK